MEVTGALTDVPPSAGSQKDETSVQAAGDSSLDTCTSKDNADSMESDTPKQSELLGGDNAYEKVAQATADEINPYAYLDTDEFSTEKYKIEINHPKRFGVGQIKKRMVSLGLKPSKVKVIDYIKCAFVNFRCEEDRDKALELLDGHQWLGKPMKVKRAKGSADPLLKKRKMEAESSANADGPDNKAAKLAETKSDMPVGERLNDAVTPLWRVTYEDQVQRKLTNMEEYFQRLGKTIQQNNTSMRGWLAQQREKNDGLCCRLLPVKTSPVLEGYRNKAEFTIGKSMDGKDKTVGFRLGQYRSGNLCVVEPTDCVNIPETMKCMAKSVQTYLQDHSDYAGFDPETRSGHWHTLTLRHNRADHIMGILQFVPQKLTKEEIDKEETSLRQFLQTGAGQPSFSQLGGTSFYLLVKSDRNDGPPPQSRELTEPQPFLENLLHLQFRISPDAFFQVNTLGAEVLYETVGEFCGVSANSTVLDVCCGTGTIGLTLAKTVAKVIGIEMCAEAVKDAKYNATLNNIDNAEFHCGKAEDVLPWLIHKLRGQEVIAVVDPPRAGLHVDVVKALRRAHFVKRLIYVSCKPTAALANLTDFTRSESRRVRGPPFRVLEAIPIDLFPHTPHCELLIKLEREDDEAEGQTDNVQCQVPGKSEVQGQMDVSKIEGQTGDEGQVPIAEVTGDAGFGSLSAD